MSTKNLSRTIIEGGRCRYYQSEVRACLHSERAELRTHLRSLALDPKLEEDLTHPQRQPVSPCFADKLNPIYRFLDSRVGRPWDATRSELFQKFDSRTTPGRHVLFDHLLRDVDEGKSGESPWYSRTYVVGADGVLRKDDAWRRRPPYSGYTKRPAREGWVQAAAWLAGRKVGKMGGRFAWYVATKNPRRVGTIFVREFEYVMLSSSGEVLYYESIPMPGKEHLVTKRPVLATFMSFRQAGALSSNEEAVFRAFPEAVRQKILEMAPVNMG